MNVKQVRLCAVVGGEALCVVLAVLLVVAWSVGPLCRPMVAWASADATKGLQVVAGRVNVHHADQRMLGVLDVARGDRDAWVGGRFICGTWQFQPVDCIPIIGDFFRFTGSTEERDQHGLDWLPRTGSWCAGHTVVSVPLLWLALVPAMMAVLIDRKRRRLVCAAKVGRCAACGYSLAGLGGEAACPECGSARACDSG